MPNLPINIREIYQSTIEEYCKQHGIPTETISSILTEEWYIVHDINASSVITELSFRYCLRVSLVVEANLHSRIQVVLMLSAGFMTIIV